MNKLFKDRNSRKARASSIRRWVLFIAGAALSAAIATWFVQWLRGRGGGATPRARQRTAPIPTSDLPKVQGLTEVEAAARAADPDHQPLTFRTYRSRGQIWRDNLLTYFNLDLIGLALAMFLLDRPWSTLSSLLILAFNVGLNVGQELWARRKMIQIDNEVRPRPIVVRQGTPRSVEIGEIVRGDVVAIRPGDQLVADGVIVGEGNLVIDDSTLSGDRTPQARHEGDPILAGSLCLEGHGVYEVEQLAGERRIDELLDDEEQTQRQLTPLQQVIRRILRILLVLVWVTAIPLVLGYFSVNTEVMREEFRAAVSVVFGLAPASLFLTIFVSYAFGSAYISRINVLVHQPQVVESLNYIDTLCLGKAGILTGTQIELDANMSAAETLGVSENQIRAALGDFAHSAPGWHAALQALRHAFDGDLRPVRSAVGSLRQEGWMALVFEDVDMRGTYVIGYPEVLAPYMLDEEVEPSTAQEGSTVRSFMKRAGSGLRRRIPRREALSPTSASTPPDQSPRSRLSQRLRSSSLADRGAAAVRWGSDRLPSRSSQEKETEEPTSEVRAVEFLFAYHRQSPPLQMEDGQPVLPLDLIPIAMTRIYESIRPEIAATVREIANTEVDIKILASDSLESVAEIAPQVGLDEGAEQDEVVAGESLEGLTAGELAQILEEKRLFGGLRPDQKEDLVQALRKAGHYATMAGDSVGDVGAMRSAEVSVAPSAASLAALGTADILLLKDTLEALPLLFMEGRRIFNGVFSNLRLSLTQISYQIILITAALFTSLMFPYVPQQGAMIVIFTLVWPAVGLSLFAPTTPSPRLSVRRRLAIFVVPAAISAAVLAQVVRLTFLSMTGSETYAQWAVVFALIAMGIMLVLFVQPPGPSWDSGETVRGSRKLIAWELASIPVFVIALSLPIVKELTKLDFLQRPVDYVIIAIYVFAWWIILRSLWRMKWVRRYVERASGWLEVEE